jgi:hypothetical protein
VRRDDGRFAIGRPVWSAAIDRHPAAIMLCEMPKTSHSLFGRPLITVSD